MIGKRVYPDDRGVLNLGAGDYGFQPADKLWYATPPGCNGPTPLVGMGQFVIEHSDGTITATKPILRIGKGGRDQWLGTLEKGKWTKT